ncbi:MAG: Putrescine oxidase [Luteibacter sp.]|uniref:flavin monoamine oxidase family protein n=1 Tax=Luteibacter sp. TaxID=1886636 RepID=UPI0013845407|nr:FAD-dependent oxidoreductase [Luteibacter sp.]KAF1004658.1 MAG: Putrescine oxidase [Luteibacter sp.]
MLSFRVVIVGAGIAGLYAAVHLLERGVDEVLVLEARDRIGGRVLSLPEGSTRYDLGATWYWPAMQDELHALISRLGVTTLAQHEAGDMLVERTVSRSPDRFTGFASAPPSMRLAGGMASLADALVRRIPEDRLRLGHRVADMTADGDGVTVRAIRDDGAFVVFHADHVLLAIPPRLATAIDMQPALSTGTQRQWNAVGTWMAPHAKYVAVYDTPFWRHEGLSGHARSTTGPLVEIHDASADDGEGALFGFIGVPATMRRRMPDAALRELCRAQLVRLFGPRAGEPRAEYVKDWAADPCTATQADQMAGGHHDTAAAIGHGDGPWQHFLTGIASEWSPSMPGYIAGAVEAARQGANRAIGLIPSATASSVALPESSHEA